MQFPNIRLNSLEEFHEPFVPVGLNTERDYGSYETEVTTIENYKKE